MRTARDGEQVIDTVDDFITALLLRRKECTEAEAIKLLWNAIDHLERYGVTYSLSRNATTDEAEIVLNVERVPALQRRTSYRVKDDAAVELVAKV